MEEWMLSVDVFSRFVADYPDSSGQEKEAAQRRIALSYIYATSWSSAEKAITIYLNQFPETEYAGEMYYLMGLAEANQDKPEAALESLGLALDRLDDSLFVDTVKDTIRQISDGQSLKNGEIH